MITKNFKAIIRLPFLGDTSNTNKCSVKKINGENSYPCLYNQASTSFGLNIMANESYRKIIVGNGTTPPSSDDYALENMITGLTINTSDSFPNYNEQKIGDGDNMYNVLNNYGVVNITATATNNTDNDITISEIGFVVALSSSSIEEGIMIDREVFSPITIHPDESYSFYIKIG